MGNRHVSVMIAAPPETVFGLYTDPGRARDRQSGVRDLRVAGPPDRPGTQAVIVYRWPFKMTPRCCRWSHPAATSSASRSCWGWSPARPPPGLDWLRESSNA